MTRVCIVKVYRDQIAGVFSSYEKAIRYIKSRHPGATTVITTISANKYDVDMRHGDDIDEYVIEMMEVDHDC